MREKGSLLAALLVALGLTGMVLAQRAKEDSRTMERNEHDYRRPNANAPQELHQFAFLLGKWRGEAKLKREDGTWDRKSWVGL